MSKNKVLIGSPIHQKPEILSEFLYSLDHLNQDDTELSFYFIDDNKDPESTRLLYEFQQKAKRVKIERSSYSDVYVKDHSTHYWNEHLVWKVAAFKDSMIQYADQQGFDYLFLVDSDLLLYPETISHLVKQEKDILSEVFWTRWQPDSMEQPQVWLSDEYTQYQKGRGDQLSDEEATTRFHEFISQMKVPGVYEVGGLGACTLLSRKALQKGVGFGQIYNLSFWGEDRHFCIRAAAIGFKLYADTHYPPYHIYRDTDLEGADDFFLKAHKKTRIRIKSEYKPKLTLSMIVRNEENRFLKEVLEHHASCIDHAVIINDGSTDRTLEICKERLSGVPYVIVTNEASKFHNEIELRKQQWEETIATNPDWILSLDADEFFEDGFCEELNKLMHNKEFDLHSFRLYDFWNETHYREDHMWRAHHVFRPFLLKYRPGFSYKWKETALHCGRMPENVFQLPNAISPIRVKHFGWSREKDRLEKFKRYLELDSNFHYGVKEQYESILDPHPNLIEWKD
ncbi:glycosyltransferase [Bacillus sp. SJS]|uniref:glycosyltransferase n=1 Tax=Bacillus sp. SJS TaxID=1423321 RepID=UPI0004DCEC61|nr:glycosyltransferase family 2 protein [Bacillus sp. SJS]KZZ84258.1 glycosyl transferase [Bacillus sp. SJS]